MQTEGSANELQPFPRVMISEEQNVSYGPIRTRSPQSDAAMVAQAIQQGVQAWSSFLEYRNHKHRLTFP